MTTEHTTHEPAEKLHDTHAGLTGDDPIVQDAIEDIAVAVLKAADRVRAEREQERLTALHLVDIHALIDAALAEPGCLDIEDLLSDARELDGQLSTDDAAHLWKRLYDLREQATPAADDAAVWADHLCYVSINTQPWEHMQPAAKALYDGGLAMLESEQGSLEVKIGHLLMLDALIASPEAAQHVVRRVRDLLVESDPALAMFAR